MEETITNIINFIKEAPLPEKHEELRRKVENCYENINGNIDRITTDQKEILKYIENNENTENFKDLYRQEMVTKEMYDHRKELNKKDEEIRERLAILVTVLWLNNLKYMNNFQILDSLKIESKVFEKIGDYQNKLIESFEKVQDRSIDSFESILTKNNERNVEMIERLQKQMIKDNDNFNKIMITFCEKFNINKPDIKTEFNKPFKKIETEIDKYKDNKVIENDRDVKNEQENDKLPELPPLPDELKFGGDDINE